MNEDRHVWMNLNELVCKFKKNIQKAIQMEANSFPGARCLSLHMHCHWARCLSLHMPSGHWKTKPALGTPHALMASSHCHSYHSTASLSIDHPEEVSLSSCWSFLILALARLSSSCVAYNCEAGTVASHDGAAGGENDHCGCGCGGCGHAPPPAGCDAPPPAGCGAGCH